MSHPLRVGDVEIAHGQATELLILHGRWPGSTRLSPDDADQLAALLREQAEHGRQINNNGAGNVQGPDMSGP